MLFQRGSLFILLLLKSTASHAQLNQDVARRNVEPEIRFSDSPVQGVRKMSDDEGEKFYFEYWQFESDSETNSGNISSPTNLDLDTRSLQQTQDETESPAQFLPRLHPLTESLPGLVDPGLSLRNLARDFKCPAGTNACLDINRSDRCCGVGDTCEVIQDTGHGTVGCCPKGQSCSRRVGSCQSGYTACSKELGGGCCIPGYECVEGGCAYVSIVTVTVDHTLTTSTITYSTRPQTTNSASTSTTSTSTTSSTSEESTTSSSTENLTAPARPTRQSTETTNAHSTTDRSDMCPTGFYACSAVYHGGCCQTGRDCDTTSCPTTRSTTFTSNGETIVVPVATRVSSSGRCAQGWFRCADTVGGGCCPRGYACGASCTATAATSTVAKEEPTGGAQLGRVDKRGLGAVLMVIYVWLN